MLFLGGNNDKSHYEQLPQGWARSRLIDLYNFIDYRGVTPQKTLLGVPLVTAKNVKTGYIDYTIDEYISRESYNDRKGRGISKKGDILFTTEAPLGNVAIADLDEYSAGQRIITLQDYHENQQLNNKLFMLFLLSTFFQEQLREKQTGTTVFGIKAEKLKRLLLPVPPLAEEQRIVDVIESAFAMIDEIERNKTNLQAIIAAAKSKILSLAICGKLVPQDSADEPADALLERIRTERESLIKQRKIKRNKSENVAPISVDNSYYGKLEFDLPDSWRWYRLADYWDLLSGRDLTPTEYSDEQIGIPYITGASNFTNNGLIINRWTSQPKVIAKDGDLLITCKGTVWEMRINTQGEIHIARQIMAIRNLGVLNIEFLRIVIDSFAIKIISAAKGIIPGISREDLLNMLIPCPPLFEQARIVKAINDANYALNEVVENLN